MIYTLLLQRFSQKNCNFALAQEGHPQHKVPAIAQKKH